nr:hypothetical protein [Tanacetum cinerariifolium]
MSIPSQDESSINQPVEYEAKEEEGMESSATEYMNHGMTVKDEEEVESKEEFEEGTEKEIEDDDKDNP